MGEMLDMFDQACERRKTGKTTTKAVEPAQAQATEPAQIRRPAPPKQPTWSPFKDAREPGEEG